MTGAPGTGFGRRAAVRLTMWLDVRDRHRHGSLGVELVKRARAEGLAGATVFEGRLGFGAGGDVHRERLFSDDRPLAIVVVDRADRIEAFLQRLEGYAPGVVTTVEDVEIVDV